MDADFISYYKDNLAFLRQQSEVFASQYPKIAKNLGLSSFECADPFVERLLEGVAFLSARNEQKLDQGATFILQDLLSSFAPALAIPHPALANCLLTKYTFDGFKTIQLGSQFKISVKQTVCKFSTLFDVELAPIVFSEPEQHYQLEDLLKGYYDSSKTKSALSLKFDIDEASNLPQDIELFLNLSEIDAGLIAQLLNMNLTGVFIQDQATGKITPLEYQVASFEKDPMLNSLLESGLSKDTIAQAFYFAESPSNQSLSQKTRLSASFKSSPNKTPEYAKSDLGIYASLSILTKNNLMANILGIGAGMSYLVLYSAYPQLCKYVLLHNLGQALKSNLQLKQGRIFFTFDTLYPKLNLSSNSFLTNVLPLINCFPKRCSYTSLSLRSYYHVIPERPQPDNFEVITISSIEVLGSDHNIQHTAVPYFSRSLESDQLFFIQHRQERAKGTFIPRTPYNRSECFVSLCSADFKQLIRPHLNLVANTYCSNADLPMFIKQGENIESLDEEITTTLLDLKLEVEPALIMRSNQQSYALLGYFNLHINSLLAQDEERMRLSLQELLKAYAAPHGTPEFELLSQSLVSLVKRPQTFRHIHQGIVFFEPGLHLELYFDPEKSGGSSLFFLAQILCTMLQSFSPLNEHCEVVAYTKKGEVLAQSRHLPFNEEA